MICETMYSNTPDGLCGNDDAGQMSAWYIFSSLGFYPVCPGSDEYAIGSPGIKSARLNLENGKIFTIEVLNQSKENIYIRKVNLNGTELNRKFLSHKEIMEGGSLSFIMGNKPVK
jgi:putative alpha-1,2-mannosidase